MVVEHLRLLRRRHHLRLRPARLRKHLQLALTASLKMAGLTRLVAQLPEGLDRLQILLQHHRAPAVLNRVSFYMTPPCRNTSSLRIPTQTRKLTTGLAMRLTRRA